MKVERFYAQVGSLAEEAASQRRRVLMEMYPDPVNPGVVECSAITADFSTTAEIVRRIPAVCLFFPSRLSELK